MSTGSDTESLFSQVLALPREKRESFLDAVCGQNHKVKSNIMSLLNASEKSDDYFDELSQSLSQFDSQQVATSSAENVKVGPWQVLSLLGQGGMGCVYLAERSQTGFTQRAAIKVLPINANDPVSRYRFSAERRILATLNHKNIAKFIDGSATQEGVHYFAMEYVEGTPIDDYCKENSLDITQKICLFLDVCNAIDYAHSKLVIHRDIKPSNILVDEHGSIKLLDFGIAKVLQDSTDSPQLTRAAFCPLSPGYASPEMLKNEEVGIASDIYSLGILLYELLTQQKLHDNPKNLLDILAAQELHSHTRPSSRVRDAKVRKQVQGDIDTIIAKAINIDPNQRYSSVKSLSRDIKNHLNGYPIEAQTSTSLYKIIKFVRRHRVTSLAAGAVSLTLILATFFSLQKMTEAQQQRDLALYQQQSAMASNDFLKRILDEVGPDGKILTLKELLDRGVSMLEKQYRGKNEFIGHMYADLSRIYHSIDDHTMTFQLLDNAEHIAKEQSDWDLLANVLCRKAELNFRQEPSLAKQQYDKAQQINTRLAATSIYNAIACDCAQAKWLEEDNQLDAALKVITQSLNRLREISPFEGRSHLLLINRRTILLYKLGRHTDVISSNAEAIRILEQSGRTSTITYMQALQNRSTLLSNSGEIISAMALQDKIFAHFATYDAEQRLPPRFLSSRADRLMRLARYEEASALYTIGLKHFRSQNNTFLVAHQQLNLGKIMIARGDYSTADAYFSLAEEEYGKNPRQNQMQLNRVALARIQLLHRRSALGDASIATEKLLSAMNYPQNKRGFILSQTLREATEIALARGQYERANTYAADFASSARRLERNTGASADVAYAMALQAQITSAEGKQALAITQLSAAVKNLSAAAGADHPYTTRARRLLSELRSSIGLDDKNITLDPLAAIPSRA